MSDDLILVVRCQSGDIDAFDELVLKYQRRVVNLAYQILLNQEEAKESALKSFLNVYYSIKRFKKEASFYTWLYRIVVNHCLKQLKGWDREKENIWEDLLENKLSKKQGLDETEAKQLFDDSFQELQQLPSQKPQNTISDEERIIAILNTIHNLSAKEIGIILRCSEKKIQDVLYKIKEIMPSTEETLWQEMDVPPDFSSLIHKKVVEEGLSEGIFKGNVSDFIKDKISLKWGVILFILFVFLINKWLQKPPALKDVTSLSKETSTPLLSKGTYSHPLQEVLPPKMHVTEISEAPEVSIPIKTIAKGATSQKKIIKEISLPEMLPLPKVLPPRKQKDIQDVGTTDTLESEDTLDSYALGDSIIRLNDPLENHYIRLEDLSLVFDKKKYPSLGEEIDSNKNKIKGIVSDLIGNKRVYEVDSEQDVRQELVSAINQRLLKGKINQVRMKMVTSNKKGW